MWKDRAKNTSQGSVAFSTYFKVLLPNREWVRPFLTLCVRNVKACSQASTKKSFCCHSPLTKKSCEIKERSLPQTAARPFFRQPPKPHTLLPGLAKWIVLGTCMTTICVLGVFLLPGFFFFGGQCTICENTYAFESPSTIKNWQVWM